MSAPETDTATNLLERLAERAVSAGAGRAAAQVRAVQAANPDAGPADVVALLERRFRRRVQTVSALVGLSAAVPGLGTVVAAGLTAANVAAFLRVSTTFISSVAHLHGVEIDDLPRRRTLLLASLLGQDGSRAVTGKVGVSSLYWGRGLLTRLPLGTVRAVNRGLARRVVRTLGAKGGAMMLGRLAPFGIGAVVGWWVGGRLARQVTDGARDAFGPPPAT